jgi:undecaprenyl-diphosphatase
VPPSDDRRRCAADGTGRALTVVVNPSSGSSTDIAATVRGRLPAARIVELEGKDQLLRRLDEAASDCDVLGIAGGDGSVATAVGIALAHSRPLLVLPAGTLNHLARDLRIESAEDAIDAFAAGETVGVDVAAVDGQLFVNTAGLGPTRRCSPTVNASNPGSDAGPVNWWRSSRPSSNPPRLMSPSTVSGDRSG